MIVAQVMLRSMMIRIAIHVVVFGHAMESARRLYQTSRDMCSCEATALMAEGDGPVCAVECAVVRSRATAAVC